MADRSRGRAALTRRIDDDARFIRIGRATTADEARAQTAGLAAQLVVIDGDRDDDALLDVVREVRTTGEHLTIAVHAGQAIPAGGRAELLDAGATVVVRKAGRQNLLNTCADHAQNNPDVPF